MPSTLMTASRGLLRRPRTSLSAVGTLALGIACSIVGFSAVNTAIVQPLPVPRAEDVYSLRTILTDGRFTAGLVAPAEVFGLAAVTDDIIGAAVGLGQELTLHTAAGAFEIRSYSVSRGFLELFGTQFHLGRGFLAAEHEPGRATVVVSHSAWQRYFGSDPAIVGQSVRIADRAMEVVGVTGPAFDLFDGTEVWLSDHVNPASISHLYDAFVRVRPGASAAALVGPINRVMSDLAAKHPNLNTNRTLSATRLLSALIGDLRPVLLIVFSASGLLLIIAIVNVASLRLTSFVSQARETAVKSALGAGRSQLVAEQLAEASILAGCGAAGGLCAAWFGIRVLAAMGSSRLPRLAEVEFDGTVISFVVATWAATTLTVTAVPALLCWRSQIPAALNEGGRAALGSENRRIVAWLAAVQVAVGMVMVDGAGRLILSYKNLVGQDRGFTSEARLVTDVNLPRNRYPDPSHRQWWFEEATSRLQALGITRVAAATSLPLSAATDRMTSVGVLPAHDTDSSTRPTARLRIISEDFLDVMGIELLAGRAFAAGDRGDGPTVVIVSRTFAAKFLGETDPLRGQLTVPGVSRMRYVEGRPTFDPIQIVGVVADVRYTHLGAEAEPSIYLPLAQSPSPEWQFSLVSESTERDVETLGHNVRTALAELDATVPVEVTTLARLVGNSVSRQKIGMVLMSAFGAAAILLISVGVFGVVSLMVSQRSGEFAIRVALGASRGVVYRIVLRQGVSLAIVGLGVGAVAAWWTGTAMSKYVYLVSPFEPLVTVGSGAGVVVAVLVAIAPLARRASSTSLARVLRG